MTLKYELTSITQQFLGHTLYRIRALQDIPRYGIRAGKLGGWIEKEENLSQEGDCWVGQEAKVSGKACIYENAYVFGYAEISGDACVFGYARVFGDAWISGNACVSGDARVFGEAWIYEDAWVSGDACVCGNSKISGDTQLGSGIHKDVILPASQEIQATNSVQVPETISDPKTWKKLGLCPQCGEKGPFINLATVCSKHGVY